MAPRSACLPNRLAANTVEVTVELAALETMNKWILIPSANEVQKSHAKRSAAIEANHVAVCSAISCARFCENFGASCSVTNSLSTGILFRMLSALV